MSFQRMQAEKWNYLICHVLACDHCVLHALTKKRPLFPKAALHFFNSLHRGQQFIQGNGGEAGGVVAHRVGDDKFVSVQQRAAGVDDVRDVAFALRFVRAGPAQKSCAASI